MKNFKKIITLALTLVMLVSCMTVFASAASSRYYVDEDGWLRETATGEIHMGAYLDPDGNLYNNGKLVSHTVPAKDPNNPDSLADLNRKDYNSWQEQKAQSHGTHAYDTYVDGYGYLMSYARVRPDNKSVRFTDVPENAWYAEAVYAMTEMGLLNGVGNNKFDPNGTITVGQWALICQRLTGVNGSYVIASTAHANGWEDTLYFGATTAVSSEMKIFDRPLSGEYNSTLSTILHDANIRKNVGPFENEPLLRGEAIVHIVRMLNKSMLTPDIQTQLANAKAAGNRVWAIADIPDAKVVQNPPYASKYLTAAGLQAKDPYFERAEYWLTHNQRDYTANEIVMAYNLGVVNGTDAKGTCSPTRSITRAVACQMLYNAGIVDLLKKHPETGDTYLRIETDYPYDDRDPQFHGFA